MQNRIFYIKGKLKAILRPFIISAKECARYHKSTKRICKLLLKPFPRLSERIRRIGSSPEHVSVNNPFINEVSCQDIAHLSTDAAFVYEKIIESVKKLDKGRFF